MDGASNINTIVRAQIVFLISTLTDDNYDRNLNSMRTVCPFFSATAACPGPR
jgi:hypothetical protein